ncbi:Uncharacterised protein [BD1-7 clade bacterium]|uniref:Hemerythrin-like domain-containing protein n=1 Tax=BD1-7 clade bacterium TaxID=2029982 RepID=A0A5S9QWX2_9GAMM|nr:Uncharacterised protein [BD1-7 clade bacterium]
MTDMYTQLVEDHVVLTDLLNSLEVVFSHYDENTDFNPDLGLILDTLEYITNYPEAYHHPLEERAFKYLLKRHMGDANIIREIQTQHIALEEETLELTRLFNAVANDCVVPIEELKTRLRHYVDAQRQHISTENINIFPVLAKLEESDWWDIASGLAIENLPCLPDDPCRSAYLDTVQYIREQSEKAYPELAS